MKRMNLILFLIGFVSILTSCSLGSQSGNTFDNTTEINGSVTITITRNGVPLIPTDFIENTTARSKPPPRDIPMLYAYSHTGEYLGSSYANVSQDADDLGKGIYRWTMRILRDKLPGTVYFRVSFPMQKVYDTPSNTTEGIWVSDGNSNVDLGIINYDIIQISGTLPVSVNGEPHEGIYNVVDRAQMHIFYGYLTPPVRYSTEPNIITTILPNGNWSEYIVQPDSERSLKFQIESRKGGGVFRKNLNEQEVITVYNTDKEVIFSDYQSIDFEAFTLSGTININTSGKRLYWYEIYFYENGANPSFESDHIGWVEVMNPDSERGGIFKWQTLVPACSFPNKLPVRIRALIGDNLYYTDTSININAYADLENIGFVFPDKQTKIYENSSGGGSSGHGSSEIVP